MDDQLQAFLPFFFSWEWGAPKHEICMMEGLPPIKILTTQLIAHESLVIWMIS